MQSCAAPCSPKTVLIIAAGLKPCCPAACQVQGVWSISITPDPNLYVKVHSGATLYYVMDWRSRWVHVVMQRTCCGFTWCPCWAQVQGLMDIFDRDWCNVFVWTHNGAALYHVARDTAYWRACFDVLAEFWWAHVVPARHALAAGKLDAAQLCR